MKNIIFILFFALNFNAKAQITLEYVYDNASNYSPRRNQLFIVHFEISGERFVRINKDSKTIDIYDLNHSFVKSISFSSFPQQSNYQPSILYLSETLFNSDSKIEFMYIYTEGTVSIANTEIYNEDGLLIFHVDSMAPLVPINFPTQHYPIYNTTHGTKMILSHQFTGEAKVYNLPGTLTTSIAEANNNLIAQSSLSYPYPNPVSNTTKVDFQLPEGINQGELVFYNVQGIEVKRHRVDRTFNTLLISTLDIPAGTYFYQLQTDNEKSAGKKMIVIK